MTEDMKTVLTEVQRGRSPYDTLRLDARRVARAVRQCTDAGLIEQPRGKRVLTESGRKAIAAP